MATLTTWLKPFIASSCPKHTLSRLYSTKPVPVAESTAHSKWSLHGIPRPKSILEDDGAKIDLSEDNDAANGIDPDTSVLPHQRKPPRGPTPPEYKEHRKTLQKRFPDGWSPPKKLSREAMDGLRQLHRFDPEKFTTPVLAEKFRISPEAIRRILRSKWEPSREKRLQLVAKEREERGERIRLSRLKERMEAQEVEEFKKATEAPAGRDTTAGKDGFTFT